MKYQKQSVNLFFISHALLTLHDQILRCQNFWTGTIHTLPYKLNATNEYNNGRSTETPDRLSLLIYAKEWTTLGYELDCFSIFQLTTKFCGCIGLEPMTPSFFHYDTNSCSSL